MNKYEHLLGYLEHATFPMEYKAHETLKELFQRATPMKPIRYDNGDYKCPNCKCFGVQISIRARQLSSDDQYLPMHLNYCRHCGQAIDWSDEK